MATQIDSTRRREDTPPSRWNEPAGSIVIKGAIFIAPVALLAKMFVG